MEDKNSSPAPYEQNRPTQLPFMKFNLSRRMGKPTICICENKDADQLRSNCEADQRLCFRHTDRTIHLLSKSKISGLYLSSVTVQAGLCWTWSEPKLLFFSSTGSFEISPKALYLRVCKESSVESRFETSLSWK